MASMSTDPTALYEARIAAVPYSGRVLPHLREYLESLLEASVAQHTLVRTVEYGVEPGQEFDTVTVRLRFGAASDAEASGITREAGERVGVTDEHWRLVGVTVEQVGVGS